MTPQEKAEELIKKFFEPVRWKLGQENVTQRAKQCALIAVDELLNDTDASSPFEIDRLEYWQEVKQEINKL